ncbi:MAG: 50S ribosomal protein L18 [Nitrosomonas sp.]|nr:MAG: 50S ribosomal protein L18 [Nitrosomonas sp.]
MQNLRDKRKNRSKKCRFLILKSGNIRLSVHRTNMHIYAQLIDDKIQKTITSASSLDSILEKKDGITGGNITGAIAVGRLLAERAIKLGITTIAFDRSGYKYHGRVKALAEAARENGLIF